MKTTVVCIVMLLVSGTSIAQSIERHVISSFGFSYGGPQIQQDCTLGETIVASGQNGSIVLTQGFQQPFLSNALCPGDFDNNGTVNVADLLIFTGEFGCVSNCGLPDMDGNGAVNVSDLLLFLAVFGNICP